MSLCPKHANRKTYDVANMALRCAQCVFAILVAALSGVDLGRWSQSGSHADSRWIYAEVVSVVSILTAWACGFRQRRAQSRASLGFCVFWQAVLSLLWVVVSAVYGQLAASDSAAAAEELDVTGPAVGMAFAASSFSTLLWVLDALEACARCTAGRAGRAEKVGAEEQGGQGLEEEGVRVIGLEGTGETEETETRGAQEMNGQSSEALPPYSEVESTVEIGKSIARCDEESSGCGNCVQFGVPCDFLPLLERKRWATTTATTATRRQQVTKRRRGRPRADWSGWALRAHDEALAPSSPLSSPSSSSSSSNQLQIRLSQPVPLHTQLNLQLAELAVDDLALLHHYHTVTAPTLGDARLWRDAAPRLGREHPCIFHIMLSLSAYHLARLRPATTTSSASAAHCRRLAEHHYEAAVRLAVPMLPRLDVGNCQALYVVTVLICFTAFARGPSSSGDLLLVAQQQGLVPWMSLLRGVRFVLETVGSATVLSGFLAPVPETTPEACYACRSGCGRCFAALAQRRAWNWRETLGRIQDVAAKKTCSDAASTAATAAAKICDGAIRSLVRCFETTFREDDATMPKTCTQGQVHVVMAWAYTLDPDFVAKLAESDEISLVLLGHFAVLVQTLGRYWFIEGWGEHILREVRQILGEEWADLLPYEFYNARC
ncbi:hypothetical protein NHJ6243_003725 [Beauveria neobassiana]